jgi:hypothetical protein
LWSPAEAALDYLAVPVILPSTLRLIDSTAGPGNKKTGSTTQGEDIAFRGKHFGGPGSVLVHSSRPTLLPQRALLLLSQRPVPQDFVRSDVSVQLRAFAELLQRHRHPVPHGARFKNASFWCCGWQRLTCSSLLAREQASAQTTCSASALGRVGQTSSSQPFFPCRRLKFSCFPLLSSDSSAQTVTGTDQYSYPVPPLITSVSGCKNGEPC